MKTEIEIEKKLLLHICCSPCLVYPYSVISSNNLNNSINLDALNSRENQDRQSIIYDKFAKIIGYFYNPNIHPYSEYLKREESLRKFSETIGLKVIYEKDYDIEEFIRNVVFREENRCYYCVGSRLEKTAALAKSSKFTHFSTTLLYSKHQDHDYIKETGFNLQKKYGVNFYYEDFRRGYKEGIELSRSYGLYRQNYCGCIYSEKERFFSKSLKS
ncbi:MAG: epoxyqueuosine reductase QueH, partial [Candidatus Acidulodesulfobacterium sp.]